MNSKIIVPAIAGGLTLFATGFIFYVLLLAGFFEIDAAKDPPAFLFIVLGELVWGLVLVWVFVRCRVTTPADGAKTGATFGFLVALAIGLIMYGATTIADLNYYLADAAVWAVRFGAAGAVIGWLLGRGATASAGG